MTIVENPGMYKGYRICVDSWLPKNMIYFSKALPKWGLCPITDCDTFNCHPESVEGVKNYIDKLTLPQEFHDKLHDVLNGV